MSIQKIIVILKSGDEVNGFVEWVMSSKRFKEREVEGKRKNGIRRWRSELARFGEEVIPLIPEGLADAVIGRVEETTPVSPEMEEYLARLKLVAAVRPGVGRNPHRMLLDIISQKK